MTTEPGGQAHIVELLRARRDAVLDRWVELAGTGLRGRLTEVELRGELDDLLGLLLRTLDGADAGTAHGELRATLSEMSRRRARQAFSPTETAFSVFALKQVVYELVRADGPDRRRLAEELIAFSHTMDELGLLTFETYVATREQVISDQAEQLLELSTPVVKLWEGIVAVPLVGTLDSARTQVVMETLLQTLVDTGSLYAVIDITGVAAVDTEVAQHLMKTIMAARLMGAECVISGIRPQIAQTVVALGIEFGDIVSKASLADALEYLLARSGVRIVRGEAG
ncbi:MULTISPECIES: STAS domain-containing protein [Thermomonospora]|uniref:RsbT co-antagonist protein RsbR n=1 Tax=Thermomonospora cellulosilytica TaxID=1411118 RepID=A0A7W3N258_9ACTN|nr:MULTISPECIES: STAS domain-containing protein [Thermomonospora]MBA9006175.1 rsbT co-antagonist protein RsbR [Thermomonospora cellulosilytica]